MLKLRLLLLSIYFVLIHREAIRNFTLTVRNVVLDRQAKLHRKK
jgi:hypothetical protein